MESFRVSSEVVTVDIYLSSVCVASIALRFTYIRHNLVYFAHSPTLLKKPCILALL